MKKLTITVLLILLAGASFYYSLFWGWASGAGTPSNAAELKTSSNIALTLSGLSIVVVIAVWIAPLFTKNKE